MKVKLGDPGVGISWLFLLLHLQFQFWIVNIVAESAECAMPVNPEQPKRKVSFYKASLKPLIKENSRVQVRLDQW